MIAQAKISLLSNRLARSDGRRIPENVLERDYCLAWFLVALSKTPLRDRLAFKGGTALKRCYYRDYRFSADLDFSLIAEEPFESIRPELDLVFQEAQRASGIRFSFLELDPETHQNSYTFYLGYEGPLPPTGRKQIKVDITIREILVFPLNDQHILRSYDEYEDLPEGATVRTYTLDEIAVEKVAALIDPARTEPRDLYDIWYLDQHHGVQLETLVGPVERKLGFRRKKLDDLRGQLDVKRTRLERSWKNRLDSQMAELPEFQAVYRSVRRAFRQAGLGPR